MKRLQSQKVGCTHSPPLKQENKSAKETQKAPPHQAETDSTLLLPGHQALPELHGTQDAHPRQPQHSSGASLTGGISSVPHTTARPHPWQGGDMGSQSTLLQYVPSGPQASPTWAFSNHNYKFLAPRQGRGYGARGVAEKVPEIFKHCSSSLFHKCRGHNINQGRWKGLLALGMQ